MPISIQPKNNPAVEPFRMNEHNLNTFLPDLMMSSSIVICSENLRCKSL